MNTKIIKTNNTNNIIYSNTDIVSVIEKRITAGNNGSTIFLPHVCNNIDMFGGGFAAYIADKYPSVKANYHLLGKSFLKTNLGHAQIVKIKQDPKYKHSIYVVNMIAQNGIKNINNPRPLNYAALVKSMSQLSHFIYHQTGFANKSENVEIHAPKFGSGLAGGNWNFISDLIDDIWGKYTVFIYNYKK